MQPCTCTAPARTAARVLATAQPVSSWQWMPATGPKSPVTLRVSSSIASGSVPPLVSHSATRWAPAVSAASRHRHAYSGFEVWPSKKCSASKHTSRPAATSHATESLIILRFSSSEVRSTSCTWESQLLPTSVTTGAPELSRARTWRSSCGSTSGRRVAPNAASLAYAKLAPRISPKKSVSVWLAPGQPPSMTLTPMRSRCSAMRTLSDTEKLMPTPWAPSRSVVS